MTIMNKLDTVGSSIAQITQLQTTGNVDGGSLRQSIADTGKAAPAMQQPGVAKKAGNEQLNSAVNELSGYVQNITRELNFSVDQELGRTVVTVIDESTGDVIRQIPSEEMLDLAKHLQEVRDRAAKGLLFSGDA